MRHDPPAILSGRHPSRAAAALLLFVTLLGLTPPGGAAGAGPEPHTEVSSLAALEAALETCERASCTRLAYFWSPLMPLSQLGVAEIAAAAGELRVPLVVAPGRVLDSQAGAGGALARALIDAGATVHFPSVVVTEDGAPRGNAVAGYRRAGAYRDLLAPRLEALAAGQAPPRAPLGPPPAAPIPGGPGDVPAAEPRVVWRQALQPVPGTFYRRLPGTAYIAYNQGRSVYLRDTASGERLPAPGFVDFVPTPDGRLFVTPGPDRSGLEFYVASEVIRRGRRGADTFETVLRDTAMTDQYPSVGIVGQDGPATRYRILTSKFEGLAFRDYTVRWHGVAEAAVEPAAAPRTLCPRRGLSLPMLSPDGREVAARDERTGTTWIFRIRDRNGHCEPLRDLGIQTGKVSFSAGGGLIAYGAPDGYGRSHTHVLNRRTGETTRIPGSRSQGLVIPEMIGSDRVLFLVIEEKREKAGVVRSSELRIACCLQP